MFRYLQRQSFPGLHTDIPQHDGSEPVLLMLSYQLQD